MTPFPILALDPGPTQTAWVIWDGLRILDMNTEPNDLILPRLRDHMDLTNRLDLDVSHLAVEGIASYGMSVGKEVFDTCIWIGRFIEAWDLNVRTHELVYRLKVKQHLCHDSRAKDGNIRQTLIDRFGPPGVKKAPGVLYGVSKHLWSALAVAVYAHDTRKT